MTRKREAQLRAMVAMAYHNHKKGLYSRALFKLNDRGTGEDLVQDTFLKTWNYLMKGGEINVMRAFLYHVLNDLVVDEYRKHKTVSLDTLLENGFEPNADNSESIADILDRKEALFLVRRLPVTYQRIIRMRYVQNLSLREVALITGRSKNTLAVQTHRGIEKLKKLCRPTQERPRSLRQKAILE